MEQSEVNVPGNFACPDKEQSGEGKLWPGMHDELYNNVNANQKNAN